MPPTDLCMNMLACSLTEDTSDDVPLDDPARKKRFLLRSQLASKLDDCQRTKKYGQAQKKNRHQVELSANRPKVCAPTRL